TATSAAIAATLMSAICGIDGGAPPPGFEILPMFWNPLGLQPPELANSPVAKPSIATRHQRDQRMGSNISFSVRSTAGRIQSTGDNGFMGMRTAPVLVADEKRSA